MDKLSLADLIFFSGIFHIILVVGSLAIPYLLHWKEELSKVNILIRQMFYTYAGYILFTNLCFGLISVASPQSILQSGILASCVTAFIALYWIGRIGIQFFYFDRTAAPKGLIYTAGEIMLVCLFFFFAIVYSCAFYVNVSSDLP